MVRRWRVLAAYAAVLGVSQMLWLNFAPLLSYVQRRYGVNELWASGLVLVFPVLYVLLSVHAGRMTDRRGYRFTVGAGALGMTLFAAVRLFDTRFAWLFVGQLGIAVAQPYVVNGISKLVSEWFDETQGALATGLGTLGMFVGMALGMAATPPLVAKWGLQGAMTTFLVISAVALTAFLVSTRSHASLTPLQAPEEARMGTLVGNRMLMLLCAQAFLGLGVFNGLSTFLEEMLAPHGMDAEQAGLVGGVMIVGGIVGSVVIPLASDALRRRKPFLIGCSAVATVALYPLCRTHSYRGALLFAGILGFFFLPAFALLLDLSSQLVGNARAGAATGLLMLAGNGGGVGVILAMLALKSVDGNFTSAVALLVGFLALTVVLATRIREPLLTRSATKDGL